MKYFYKALFMVLMFPMLLVTAACKLAAKVDGIVDRMMSSIMEKGEI